jgi:hypothetical protein
MIIEPWMFLAALFFIAYLVERILNTLNRIESKLEEMQGKADMNDINSTLSVIESCLLKKSDPAVEEEPCAVNYRME